MRLLTQSKDDDRDEPHGSVSGSDALALVAAPPGSVDGSARAVGDSLSSTGDGDGDPTTCDSPPNGRSNQN